MDDLEFQNWLRHSFERTFREVIAHRRYPFPFHVVMPAPLWHWGYVDPGEIVEHHRISIWKPSSWDLRLEMQPTGLVSPEQSQEILNVVRYHCDPRRNRHRIHGWDPLWGLVPAQWSSAAAECEEFTMESLRRLYLDLGSGRPVSNPHALPTSRKMMRQIERQRGAEKPPAELLDWLAVQARHHEARLDSSLQGFSWEWRAPGDWAPPIAPLEYGHTEIKRDASAENPWLALSPQMNGALIERRAKRFIEAMK